VSEYIYDDALIDKINNETLIQNCYRIECW